MDRALGDELKAGPWHYNLYFLSLIGIAERPSCKLGATLLKICERSHGCWESFSESLENSSEGFGNFDNWHTFSQSRTNLEQLELEMNIHQPIQENSPHLARHHTALKQRRPVG